MTATPTPKGLVTPVVRDCERLGFAEMEKALADFAERVQVNIF